MVHAMALHLALQHNELATINSIFHGVSWHRNHTVRNIGLGTLGFYLDYNCMEILAKAP